MKEDRKKNWLSNFFNALNDNQPGGNKPSNADKDWSIPVGQKGDKLARRPVSVNFLGTVTQFTENPSLGKEENEKHKKALENEAQENAETLKEAINILSQSSTGRYLMEEMTKNGYKIVFDDRRTGSRGAGGLCDSENKLLILRSSDDPEYVALVLGHESVHALQNSKYNMFPSSRHKPEAGIRLSFAIEADAYAQQTQIALELAYGDPTGPKNQVTFDGPLHQMRKRFPGIVEAAEKAMADKDAMNNGASVAAAFEKFYEDPRLRTFYEDAHTEWAGRYAPMLFSGAGKKFRHFSEDVDSDWIKENLNHRGRAYLKEHTPNINFDDEKHAGLTDVTREKIEDFYKAWLSDQGEPNLKAYGTHMKDAVAWVLGLIGEGGAIIVKDNKEPPVKPPLRPPPSRSFG